VSLPDILHSDEELSRFFDESNRFKRSTAGDYVLPKAFEPKFDLERQRFETSLYRTVDLSDQDVWELAKRLVEPSKKKPTLGCAQLQCSAVTSNGLHAIADEPPERHAVIVGWPEGDEKKSERKSLQLKLAAAAKPKFVSKQT
jgi:hypothetical protein